MKIKNRINYKKIKDNFIIKIILFRSVSIGDNVVEGTEPVKFSYNINVQRL